MIKRFTEYSFLIRTGDGKYAESSLVINNAPPPVLQISIVFRSICPRHPERKGNAADCHRLWHHGNLTPPGFSRSCPHWLSLWLGRSIIVTLTGHCKPWRATPGLNECSAACEYVFPRGKSKVSVALVFGCKGTGRHEITFSLFGSTLFWSLTTKKVNLFFAG